MNPRGFGALEGGFGPQINDISRAQREKFPGEFRQGNPVHAPSAFPEFKYRPDPENRVGRGIHSVYGVSAHKFAKWLAITGPRGTEKKSFLFYGGYPAVIVDYSGLWESNFPFLDAISSLLPKTGKVLPGSICEGSRVYHEDPSSGPFPSSLSRSTGKRTRSSPASQGTRCRKTPRTGHPSWRFPFPSWDHECSSAGFPPSAFLSS
jgi:hypothetical protein